MSDLKSHIEIHTEAGSAQTDRLPAALKTGFVALDERKTKDLVVFTNKMSRHINFYNEDNILLGNWSHFFEWDTASILAQISKLDIKWYLTELTAIQRQLRFVDSAVDQDKIVGHFLKNVETLVEDLHQKIEYLPEELKIKEYFLATYPTLKRLFDAVATEINGPQDKTFTLQNHLFQKKIQNLFGLLSDWRQKSVLEFKNNLESYPEHSPQYALYLSFLKLFDIAQTDLNRFTKRHLDFYYKDVLHLDPEPSRPDYVHLTVEPQKNTSAFLIEKEVFF